VNPTNGKGIPAGSWGNHMLGSTIPPSLNSPPSRFSEPYWKGGNGISAAIPGSLVPIRYVID